MKIYEARINAIFTESKLKNKIMVSQLKGNPNVILNKDFFFPPNSDTIKETPLAKDLDITKGLSDIKIPHRPDFGYPLEVQYEEKWYKNHQ